MLLVQGQDFRPTVGFSADLMLGRLATVKAFQDSEKSHTKLFPRSLTM